MADRKKVIEGLECHLMELSVGHKCYECPYWAVNPCEAQLIANALELLKEQEPRVLTLKEAFDLQGKKSYPCIFADEKNRKDVFLATINDELYGNYHSDDFKVYRPWVGASKAYRKIEYGISIRFWNEFPTDAQREAVKWDDEA